MKLRVIMDLKSSSTNHLFKKILQNKFHHNKNKFFFGHDIIENNKNQRLFLLPFAALDLLGGVTIRYTNKTTREITDTKLPYFTIKLCTFTKKDTKGFSFNLSNTFNINTFYFEKLKIYTHLYHYTFDIFLIRTLWFRTS